MRQVTGSMAGVVRGMEGAMRAMDLEKVSHLFFPEFIITKLNPSLSIFPSLDGLFRFTNPLPYPKY